MTGYRPKDICYAAQFDKKDLPSLYELAKRIRITHDQTLVDDFNLKCQKKVDDHNPILEIGNKKIEFEQISAADDLVVTAGIQRTLDLILGTSVIRWIAVKTGTGTTPPAITDTTLAINNVGVNVLTQGWAEYASSSLRFAGIFGESNGTFTLTEACVKDSIGSGGTILNRCVFSNLPITHTINVQGFVVSFVIEFVPVMS